MSDAPDRVPFPSYPSRQAGMDSQLPEPALRYCPNCSRRLEERNCKLLCPGCGYFLSCADYY